jgi:RNA polymerase sigma-70 factor (ECF subfamily)
VSQDLDVHLSAIASGSAEAFADFLSVAEWPLRQSLRSFATRLDLEAIVQEASLRLWQVAPTVESDGRANSLLRMLLRIARNLAVDEVRRRHREEPTAVLEAAGPFPSPPDPPLRRAIADCIEELPEKPREALNARLNSEGVESDAVLSLACNMRPNTFLQNVTRARRQLADCLENKGVELLGIA